MTRPPPPGERVLCDQAGRDRSGGGFNCTLIKIIFYIEFRAAYDFCIAFRAACVPRQAILDRFLCTSIANATLSFLL